MLILNEYDDDPSLDNHAHIRINFTLPETSPKATCLLQIVQCMDVSEYVFMQMELFLCKCFRKSQSPTLDISA